MSVYESSITNPKKQLEFYKDLLEQLESENRELRDNNIYFKYHIKSLEQKISFLKLQIEQNNKVLNTSIILKNKYKEVIDKLNKLEDIRLLTMYFEDGGEMSVLPYEDILDILKEVE